MIPHIPIAMFQLKAWVTRPVSALPVNPPTIVAATYQAAAWRTCSCLQAEVMVVMRAVSRAGIASP